MWSAPKPRSPKARRWSGRTGPAMSSFEVTFGDRKKNEAVFAQAARVVSLKMVNQRLVTNYLDTRGVVAEYDAARDHYTLTLGSQGSHAIRDVTAYDPENFARQDARRHAGCRRRLRHQAVSLSRICARRRRGKATGRPVKWIADRSEHFLGDTHGRDNITTARLALDDKARFLALEVDTIADMGAYLSCYAPYIPYIGAAMLPGVYDIPVCFIRVRAAYTNTVPVDAYRGAGRPEASYVIERLVDAAARDLGIEPVALRRKNFIKPKQMPYATPTGKVYDTGEFDGHMKRAQEIADWDGFKKRAAAAKKKGKLRGIGVSTYIEACGGNAPETATPEARKGRQHHAADRHRKRPGRGTTRPMRRSSPSISDLPPDRVRMHPGRHRPDRDRPRHRRIELDSGRRQFGVGRCDQAGRQAEGARRRCTGSKSARSRNRRRRRACRRHRPRRIIRRSGEAAGCDRRQAERGRCLHAEGADLSERHPSCRSRDRRGDRRDPHRQIRRGRRFRRDAQSIVAGGPGAWRHGAGHRPGVDGGHDLRCAIPASS